MDIEDTPNSDQESSSENRINPAESLAEFESLSPLKGLVVVAFNGENRVFGPAYFTQKNQFLLYYLVTSYHRMAIDGLVTKSESLFLKAVMKVHKEKGGKILLVKDHPSAKTEFIQNDRMIEVRLRHILEYTNKHVFVQKRGKEIWVFESEEILAKYPFPFTAEFRKSIRKVKRVEAKTLSESKVLRNLSLDLHLFNQVDRFIFKEILRFRFREVVIQLKAVFQSMLEKKSS
ncbi:MAG: hypothetical protein SFU91_08530 [Chloroherpetonaceae bacterium]|nr:hypothetical protein [Chloroherpetonaceae bacterium]